MRIYGGLKTLASFGNPDKCAQEGRLGMYARLSPLSVRRVLLERRSDSRPNSKRQRK